MTMLAPPLDLHVPNNFVTLGHRTPTEDRAVACDLARSLDAKSIVEVGCFTGMTTYSLLKSTRAKVYCVDHMRGNPDDILGERDPASVFRAFHRNLGRWIHKRVFLIVCDSQLAAETFPFKVDMVFLDAGHSRGAVARDIKSWTPLVRSGGILCGHDYSTEYPGVVEAVNDISPDGHRARVWWKKIHG